MAVYTHISDDQVAVFLEGYDLGTLQSFEGIEQGGSNTNYHLYTSVGHYILTLFEPARVEPEHVPFFLAYAKHLEKSGIPNAKAVEDKKGGMFGVLADRPAAIVSFLEGSHPNAAEITSELCSQVGALAGCMHVAGAKFDQVSENSYGLERWSRWVEDMGEGLIDISFGLYDAMRGELSYLKPNWPEALPVGAIHADLFSDNIFVDEAGNVSGVIDFHFVCTDYLVYDLAIIVNAWCFDEKAGFVQERYDALMQGYERKRVLTADEKVALPVLLRGAALRFVLSRCQETLAYKPGDMMKPHDPLAFIKRLEFFQNE